MSAGFCAETSEVTRKKAKTNVGCIPTPAPLPMIAPSSWRNIPISNNVGTVKHDLRTRLHALKEERHFALVGGLRFPIWGSLLIVRVKNSVRPSHLFDHNRDHDYLFELPCCWGAGCPIITSAIYCLPSGCPGSPAYEPKRLNWP